jgi:flagellar hook-basal body complex protein FliE
MSVGAIAAVGSSPLEAASVASIAPQTSGISFDSLLGSLDTLNTQLLAGEKSTTELALGSTDNLHHAMLGMEQTRLSFDLMLAVRNKLLDAYQELMRMQV